MSRTRCVLALMALCVGLADSWDIAVGFRDELRLYTNSIITNTISLKSRNLIALAYDEVHNTMLFVDKQSTGDNICGYNFVSTETKCFTKRNGRKIHGIAYDPVTESVFFTDTNEKSVNSISLQSGSDGSENLLIKMNEGTPRDIVVDSCKGYIYWLNRNYAKPTIEKARLNGAEREIFENITSLLYNSSHYIEPYSLAIDQRNQAIYWLEAGSLDQYRLFTSQMNAKSKTYVITYLIFSHTPYHILSNTLAATKNAIISVIYANTHGDFKSIPWTFAEINHMFTVEGTTIPVGMTARYKIKDQIEGVANCDALSQVSKAMENYGGSFCVHGQKINDQLICKCTPGYIGERCDVSVCENYCLQGSCSLNDAKLPECRCNAGYSGDRCEVYACQGHCWNNGDCSLNDKSEPVCQCSGGYVGDRCNVSVCANYCLQGNCSVNDKGVPECRCDIGYNGERCEVDLCHGHCLNGGECNLNEEDEPSCLCIDGYEGARCENDKNDEDPSKISLADCLNNRNLTLADV